MTNDLIVRLSSLLDKFDRDVIVIMSPRGDDITPPTVVSGNITAKKVKNKLKAAIKSIDRYDQ